MRKTLVLLLSGAALAILSAPVKADDLTIAVAGPITGSLATIGDQVKRGAEAAAVEINAAGGVNGRKLKIVVEDDQCDPKQAVAVANHIVGEQIHFVDGHICSGSSIPASAVYDDNSVLMMSPASSNPALTDKGLKTIMRLYGRDDAQGAFIAPYRGRDVQGQEDRRHARQERLRPGHRHRRARDPHILSASRKSCSKASTRAKRTTARSSASCARRALKFCTMAAIIRRRR